MGVLALALPVVLLAACGGLPDRGPVEVEPAQPSGSAAPFDFNPPGPVRDASPEQVVAGFLRAVQATRASSAAASEFLTEAAATRWRPDRRTIVYGAARTRSDGATVTVRLDDAFSLDTTGRFAGGLTGAARDLALRVTREDGEWRIAELPDALVVPRSYFASSFRPYSLFFLDSTGSMLVPERVHLRWGPQLPTRLVDGLLAGPAVGAGGVERTSFPPGAQLGVSVPVREDKVAVVPLTGDALDLDGQQVERMFAQLAWTLRQVSDVEAIRVTVGGTPVEPPVAVPESGDGVAVSAFEGFGPATDDAPEALFGVRDGQVVEVVGDEEQVVAPVPLPAARSTVAELAVSVSGDRFAVVAEGARRVVTFGRDGERQVDYQGDDVRSLMWDRGDRLWVVDRRGGGSVTVLDGEVATRLPLAGADGSGVVDAALSRDGTRLALLRRSAAGPVIAVARVRRDGDGVPVRLTAARELTTADQLHGPRAVAWWDASTVAVLTRPSATTTGVVLAAADGASAAVRQESGVDVLFDAGDDLTAGPGAPGDLVVTSVERRVHRLDPLGGWDLDAVPSGVRAATYAG